MLALFYHVTAFHFSQLSLAHLISSHLILSYIISCIQVKRKNGRKYYPPLEFVPADVGPDGKVVVPVKAKVERGKSNGAAVSFKETEEERRKREAEEEKEELERKVNGIGYGLCWVGLVWVGLG